MLHTPHYDVSTAAYCGPTAMSAITGRPISEIRYEIRRWWKDSGVPNKSNGHALPIMGIANTDLTTTMWRMGWQIIDQMKQFQASDFKGWAKPYTLDQFFKEHGSDGPYIVEVTGHYLAVSHGEVCDTYTKLPIPIERWKRGRKRWVKNWWQFSLRDASATIPDATVHKPNGDAESYHHEVH
jgi:hypothetical protein